MRFITFNRSILYRLLTDACDFRQSCTQSPQALWPAVRRHERDWGNRKKVQFFDWLSSYGLHCDTTEKNSSIPESLLRTLVRAGFASK